MFPGLKILEDLKLDNLDLSNLEIPKNIMYIIIAFKLINSFDKIVPKRNIPMPIPLRPVNNSNRFMSLFVVFMLIGGAVVLANNLLDKINISLLSCGVKSLKDSNLKMPNYNYPIKESVCPEKESVCPMKERVCPEKESVCPIRNIPNIEKCPKMSCCPFFSKEFEKKMMDIIEESENKEEQ
jgi:hypothetical protein